MMFCEPILYKAMERSLRALNYYTIYIHIWKKYNKKKIKQTKKK